MHATTTTLGPVYRHPPEGTTHHNVSEKGDRVARPETLPDSHLRCRCPSIPVMETADSLLCPGRANYIRPRFGRPSARRLLIQSEMSSVVVIIANICEAEPYQMSLVQRDHVIQHLAAYAPHPSFRDPVLPRTASACPNSFDPARFQKAAHLGAEFAVTIKDDVAVWAWKRQGLSELLQNPIPRRMRGGVEMENVAPMMLNDEEAIQRSETQRGHGEKVEGGDHLAVVLEECQPALHLRLVRLALQPLQIAQHGGFRNLKSELPQFPVDARRSR